MALLPRVDLSFEPGIPHGRQVGFWSPAQPGRDACLLCCPIYRHRPGAAVRIAANPSRFQNRTSARGRAGLRRKSGASCHRDSAVHRLAQNRDKVHWQPSHVFRCADGPCHIASPWPHTVRWRCRSAPPATRSGSAAIRPAFAIAGPVGGRSFRAPGGFQVLLSG
jgi:hypothetical protein